MKKLYRIGLAACLAVMLMGTAHAYLDPSVMTQWARGQASTGARPRKKSRTSSVLTKTRKSPLKTMLSRQTGSSKRRRSACMYRQIPGIPLWRDLCQRQG